MNIYAATPATTVPIIADLRSDTVTRPTPEMRRAMAEAEVGDDVYGDDPTVARLEAALAERLGKEAGLFLASGTQSNLVAMMAHCGRGDEIIVGKPYHTFQHEAMGASVLGGIAMYPLSVAEDRSVAAEDVTAAIKADDPHYPVSRLLCLENTVSGQAIALDHMRAPAEAARAAGLSVHLDGARFFNAVTELGCAPEDLAGIADTVSVCLSKGLGAPVGSVLVGPRDLIAKARRHRKILGGGMRQSGVLAAAGLHALAHHVDRLAEDHARARAMAGALNAFRQGAARQATNMVFFRTEDGEAKPLAAHLAALGIKITPGAPQIRFVLHHDIDDVGLAAAIDGIRSFYQG